ncbi:hypothetical protein M3Y94_00026700 [Aphelenchoides besseyi]|nr:hypothetical protein M3Y94_00026700 [Aphelenchoides besseyi]
MKPITLIVCLLLVVLVDSQMCPPGQMRLDSCIGMECPNTDEAGRVYTCINDECCAPMDMPQQVSTCIDSATNCPQFIQYCNTPIYIVCMQQHCGQTCGFCVG